MGGGGGSYTGGITGADKLEDMAKKRLEKIGSGATTYNVFIPHAWDYEDEYHRLLALLKDTEGFDFKDYSVPREDPVDANTAKELEDALRRQIAPSSVVLVPAGMYINHRDWIQREIEIAKELGKRIVAVKPWGNERIPEFISQNADEIVGWNKDSIADAIKRVRESE